MLKFLRKIVLIVLIIILLMLNFESSYKKDAFKITLNNYDLKCHYKETYQNAFLVKNGWESSNSVDRNINSVKLNNQMFLNLKEYEAYSSSGFQVDVDDWWFNNSYEYKEINSNIERLVIKRKNNILYDGKYIENVSKYVNESGRYFFHIYSKKKINLFVSIKTHISFNVIVGDLNE